MNNQTIADSNATTQRHVDRTDQPEPQLEQKVSKDSGSEDTHPSYLWIANEGLLRDEGTLFGIAAADVSDKLKAIEEYYKIKCASDTEKLRNLEDALQLHQTSLAELGESRPAFTLTEALRKEVFPQMFPVFFQLLLYSSVCWFNYFLVDYWLSPVALDWYIKVGLYAFGISALFIGRSVLYHHSADEVAGFDDQKKRESWKVVLEEFGIPLVTAAAIVAFAWEYHPSLHSICAFLLLLFLFLFAGKAAIGFVYRAGRYLSLLFGYLSKLWRFAKNKRQHLRKRKESLKASTEIKLKLSEVEAQIRRFNAEREYSIRLFLSEYQLARQGRELGIEKYSIQNS